MVQHVFAQVIYRATLRISLKCLQVNIQSLRKSTERRVLPAWSGLPFQTRVVGLGVEEVCIHKR